MSKQKRGLVSELRFPEFLNESEWNSKALGKCLDYIQPTKYLVSSTAYDDKYRTPVLTAGKTFILGYTDEAEGIFEENLPVIIFDDFTTASKFVDFPFKAKSSAMKILMAKKSVDIRFCYESMQLIRYQVGVHERHWISIFSKIEIPVPSLKEQQKIADCLASIDELISLHTQKLDTLKAHKNGLMQQLFPAEGESVPKLRFPEFKGDWVEVMLGQAAKYENGKAHEQDIDAQGQYIVVNSKFISTAGEIRKYSNSANLLSEKDDILMVLSDVPNGRAIAKCFYVDKDEKYTVNQRICKLTAKKGYVSKLLYYVIDKNPYFLAFDDGVKQTNLKKDDVLNCPLWMPNDIKEQKKIVDLLDSIDGAISHQEKKLLSLNLHKAGLLQKLFPVMDDVVS